VMTQVGGSRAAAVASWASRKRASARPVGTMTNRRRPFSGIPPPSRPPA